MNLIQELRWRGLVQDITPETEEYLAHNQVKGYVGFDPTADSLHIGNLVPVMLLVHLQRHGHTPYALVGGATGMIGDPSGRSTERQFLSEEVLRHNEACVQKQLTYFLDFQTPNNPAHLVNNYDWFKGIGVLDFLRDVGKHLTINYMMAKDSVKGRIDNEQGISYTEFTYQLVQGYDFYWLYKHEGVQLQMGGADQWGNITTGTTLIRKKEGNEAKSFALTAPLLTREDGSKFGKQADGKNVWLDASRTSPFEFYQYWLNISDVDAEKCIKIFSLLPLEDIQAKITEHAVAPHLRILQKALGMELTERVHSKDALDKALALSEFLFGGNITPEMLQGLSLESWKDVENNTAEQDIKYIPAESLAGEGLSILDVMADTAISSSKAEARRAIQQNKSVSLNGEKVIDPNTRLRSENVFFQKYIFLQSGKKNKYLICLK